MWAKCPDCKRFVRAEITHNGVCRVGHFVCCGWGHDVAVEDLMNDEDPAVMSALNSEPPDEP